MPSLIQYQLSGDANNKVHGDVLPPSQYIDAYVMAPGEAQTITIPTGARIAIFNSSANFYVNWQAAAAEPTNNITDGSGPELNPMVRDVSDYSSFSMVAPDACVVTIAYFS